MHCPVCRAEYRPGFTRCSDCDVDLVPSLPEPREPSSEFQATSSERVPSGYLVPLWEGEDLAVHASLLEELDKAGIRYFDRALGNYPDLARADPFEIRPMTQIGYEVAVLSPNLAAAREILEKLLGQEPVDFSLPESDGEIGAGPEPPPGAGDEAICEVWSGRDAQMAGFLESALRENEIPTRVASFDEVTKIYVAPSCESRAREIIREIVEGSPPS